MSPLRRSTPCVRVFLSSTFIDFRLERDLLQRAAFPRLRELCQRYGARFEDVDLRWGIAQDAAFDQRTVEICLDELRRCQEISPVPNFLLLLGDRYGWRPLPAQIERVEFERVLACLRVGASSADDLRRLRYWYRLDANAVPSSYRLRSRGGRYRQREVWARIESDLLPLLHEGALAAGIRGEPLDKYQLSATAQEVKHGVLHPPVGVPEVRGHVFVFSREFSDLPRGGDDPDLAVFCDVDESGALDLAAQEKLEQLRTRLAETLQDNVRTSSLPWRDRKKRTSLLEHLSGDIVDALAGVIERDLRRLEVVPPDVAEVERHRDYQRTRLAEFHGRQVDLEAIAAHVAGDPGTPLLVLGEGGSGKSSLMAVAASRLAEDESCRVALRFIGITRASGHFDLLVRSLGAEIGDGTAPGVTAPGSLEPEAWLGWFHRVSDAVESNHRIVLVIDALDQLGADEQQRIIEWLPPRMPQSVRIVLSAIPCEASRSYEERFGQAAVLRLGQLRPCDGRQILTGWLLEAGRDLQDVQRDSLLQGFDLHGSPLYLRLAFEEAVRWRSHQRVSIPTTLPGVIDRLLSRLERADQHGKELTRKVLSYIAISRHGLSEEELRDVLSSDHAVMKDFRKRSPESQRVDHLPFAVWARFHSDFGAYLAERGTDQSLLFNFYHRIIGERVMKRYVASEDAAFPLHQRLARYFGGLPTWVGVESYRRPNLRKLSETSFHLVRTRDFPSLFALLAADEYRGAMFAAGRKYEWLNEIEAAFNIAETAKARRRVLALVLRHLERLGGVVNHELSLEDLHAFFIYRKSGDFYPSLMELGAGRRVRAAQENAAVQRDLRLGFLSRKANRLRRCGELGKAQRILNRVTTALAGRDELATERSGAEYDLGYVHFLRGELGEAIEWLSRSAASARLGGNLLGWWTSRIVCCRVELIGALGSSRFGKAAAKFRRLLDTSEPTFRALADADTTAERWVMNVRAHRFEIAFLTADVEAARDAYLTLVTDPWLQRFEYGETLSAMRGRLALLEGRGADAVRELSAVIPDRRDVESSERTRRREALAADLFDLGRALALAGRAADGRKVWQRALDLPTDAGNKPWQRIIRLELAGATEGSRSET